MRNRDVGGHEGPAELPAPERGTPGARTLTAALPVQRRTAGPVRFAGGASVAQRADDPFALHLPDVVQRRADGPGNDDVHAAAARGIAGPAGALPHLDTISRSFGPAHDLSAVLAHTGPEAQEAAADMGALGFATGHHVAFAGAPDLHLAAHEAAHVVQQRAGVQLAGGLGAEDDAHERHADAVADRVVAGRSAADLLPAAGTAAPSVQRQAAPAADDDGVDEVAEPHAREPSAAETAAAEPHATAEADPAAADDGAEATTAAPTKLAAGKPPGAVQRRARGKPRPPARSTAAKARQRKTPIADAIIRYAPLVYLDKQEAAGPTDASEYIAHARLRWSHDQGRGDHQLADEGQIDEARLGSGGYTHQVEGQFGGHHGDVIHSNEDSRPKDGKGAGGNEGFFLEVDEGWRDQQGAGNARDAPVYHEAEDGHFITYWFFYARNPGPAETVGGSLTAGFGRHDGDWERITVKLDRFNRATRVAYYQHEGHEERPWKDVPKQGTHPIVYSARGSHASFATAGRHGAPAGSTDVTSRGAAWQTWKNVKSATRQGWYGYGGAWGEVGKIPNGTPWSANTTGPQGPGPSKSAAPEGWGSGG